MSGKFWNLMEIRSKSKKYEKESTIGTRYPKTERSKAKLKKSKTGRGLKL